MSIFQIIILLFSILKPTSQSSDCMQTHYVHVILFKLNLFHTIPLLFMSRFVIGDRPSTSSPVEMISPETPSSPVSPPIDYFTRPNPDTLQLFLNHHPQQTTKNPKWQKVFRCEDGTIRRWLSLRASEQHTL